METADHSQVSAGRIRIVRDAHGSLTYLVDALPEELPAVRKRDVEIAWDSAHRAARAGNWGVVRGFRFQRRGQDNEATPPRDLLLADANAACWAAAVDGLVGLGNLYGLSLCLRLLALVDLLTQARWADGLYRMHRGEAEMDVRLLRLAATARMTPQAGFDAAAFRATLFPPALPSPADVSPRQISPSRMSRTHAARMTGVSA